ncbi:MAG: tetratricopeptide repeat protein [Candidatus Zixiibacteriota bacterium]|nr:MAG: tetratricopeptide repeat protein [candidate division Zixibacteria bacterium]
MSKTKAPARARAEKMICGGCLLLILIHLVASYFPSERLWGINLLYYVPPAWRWILACCAILILIPSVNRACANFLTGLSRTIPPGLKSANKYYRYAFFSLIAGVLFWALRVKTYLLGDSLVRAREIDMGARFSFTAPLDFFLHVHAAKILNWDAFQTYAVLSALLGVGFVFLILVLADAIGRSSEERLLVLTVGLTLGAMQLFFGYVESYSLVCVAILLYILFSLGYLRGNGGPIPPMLAFLLAFSLHLFAVTLLPSLLYLILSRRAGERERKQGNLSRFSMSTGIVLLVAVALFLLQRHNPEPMGLGYYLISPLGSWEGSYSLFSFSHLLDLMNHQLLVSPVGLLICLTPVLAFSGKTDPKDKLTRFLLVLSLSTLAYALLIDPKLGYPRDWDLFAFTALGYTLLGLHLFLRYWRETRTGDLRYVTLSLLLTSLISTVPWIYVNATEEASVARFEHLLKLDRERSGHGHETLAMYYNVRGEWQKELEEWKKAAVTERNARYLNNVAAVYNRQQRYDLALQELDRSLAVDPTFDRTHFSRGDVLARMGRYEEALGEFRQAIKLRPDRMQYYNNLGGHLTKLGRDREAVEVLEQGLGVNPDYSPLYRDLGYNHFNLGDFVLAEKYLKLYLERAPEAEDAAEVRQFLRSLPEKGQSQSRP